MFKKKHYAAIDIGSNAVRLLIKCLTDDPEQPLSKVQLLRVPLRLGEDAFVKGKISKGKVKDLVRLMLAYKYLMQIYEVSHYRICATSAMRDASNAAKVVDEVEEETGLQIEVISGEEEARLVGHSRVRQLVRDEETYYVMVDVGGGSTEVSILRGSQKVDSRSFNIGTVRLLSGLVRKSELEEYHMFLDSIHERCGDLEIFGTGGNINRLAKINGTQTPWGKEITTPELHEIYDILEGMDLDERMSKYGMKPDRADVIIPAARIFIAAADRLGTTKIMVPKLGLADSIIDRLYEEDEE